MILVRKILFLLFFPLVSFSETHIFYAPADQAPWQTLKANTYVYVVQTGEDNFLITESEKQALKVAIKEVQKNSSQSSVKKGYVAHVSPAREYAILDFKKTFWCFRLWR